MSNYRSTRYTSWSNGLSRSRYYRPRVSRVGRTSIRTPWYAPRRVRPTIADTDRIFRDWRRERQRQRGNISYEDYDSDSEEESTEPEVTDVDLKKRLTVKSVDFHIEKNTTSHHTDMYDCTERRGANDAELVVRRGQEFLLTVKFDRPYDIKRNDITLIFNLAAGEGKSTVQEVIQVEEGKKQSYRPTSWGAKVISKEDNLLTTEVFIPANAAVGTWELTVKTTVDIVDGKDLVWQYNHIDDVHVLFNPWCKDDVVYVEDKTWLEEAVLNDSGALYWGNHVQTGVSSWYHGQFEDGILKAALHLLRRAFNFKTNRCMGDAARVSRALSQIVNSSDDNGVLEGNWSDDFAGGTKPTAWTGSVKILKQYMATGKTVKFGQCWVFSGVLTTVCRALGLPCRSVTTFESAHNSDKDNLNYDIFIKKNRNGEWVEDTSNNNDSIWNFHVWNEVWMTRPDLGAEYGGWQAIDSTPQERSDGLFCCGPAPVNAIKEGNITIGQDTPFVFSEVNADKLTWQRTTGGKKLIARDPYAVGKKISTHEPTGGALVGMQRLDLTDTYKYPDGSEKEREAVSKADRLFRRDNLTPEPVEPEEEAVEIQIENTGDVYIGEGFNFKVIVNNRSDGNRTVNVSMRVKYQTYTGIVTGTCAKKVYVKQSLRAGEIRPYQIHVTAKEALQRPLEGFNFQFEASAVVNETGNVSAKSSTFRLRRPDILVKGPSKGEANVPLEAELSFTNPLPSIMTNTEINIEGNLRPIDDRIIIGIIRPGETWRKVIKFNPARKPVLKKQRDASFALESDQLNGIVGKFVVTLK